MASNEIWNIKRFDGSDYSKFRLRFVLFIERKEWNIALDKPRPKDDTEAANWDKFDVKVRSTLIDAVTDKILDEIGHESTAKGMLDILDSVYLRKTLLMRILAKKQLLNLKMDVGEDAREFFSRFEKHISALKDAGENVSPEEKLHYLLMILPDKYSHIIDVLDAMPKESQTVDYIKGKILFDHCKSKNTQEYTIENAAMKAKITHNRNK